MLTNLQPSVWGKKNCADADGTHIWSAELSGGKRAEIGRQGLSLAPPITLSTLVLCGQTVNQMLANRMTPATPITKRDEIRSAEEGFLYKCRTAVCQMLPVTQNDGRCRLASSCWTNSLGGPKRAKIGYLESLVFTGHSHPLWGDYSSSSIQSHHDWKSSAPHCLAILRKVSPLTSLPIGIVTFRTSPVSGWTYRSFRWLPARSTGW